MKKEKKMTPKWKQKNGTIILIEAMEDAHLLNTIAMLERNAQEERNKIPYPSFQGEIAQYYAEREYETLHSLNTIELTAELCGEDYINLRREANNRKKKQRKIKKIKLATKPK